MSYQYIGEIRLFPFARGAPNDWQLCNGALLSIAEYETLYTLLGTAYGGDGVTTFAVPDLRGRIPIHQGTGLGLSSYQLGQVSGSENVTLSVSQMPSHFHVLVASTAAGSSATPTANLTATIADEPFYTSVVQGTTTPYALPATTVGSTGNNLPHENTAPTLTLNYCIALNGIYPQQQ